MKRPNNSLIATTAVGAALILCVAGCTSTSRDSREPSPTATVAGNQADYDRSVATAECLTDKGWDASVDGQGGWGVVSEVPTDQQPIYDADYESCIKVLGFDDFSVTEDSAIATYKNNTRVAECLVEAGYSVPETPTQSSFVAATLEEPNKEIWNPYALIAQDEVWSAVTACPQ